MYEIFFLFIKNNPLLNTVFYFFPVYVFKKLLNNKGFIYISFIYFINEEWSSILLQEMKFNIKTVIFHLNNQSLLLIFFFSLSLSIDLIVSHIVLLISIS